MAAAAAAFTLVTCGGRLASDRATVSDDGGVPPDQPVVSHGNDGLKVEITWREPAFDLLAVDDAGTAYGINLAAGARDLWTSPDGRTWTRRGSLAAGAGFWTMYPLHDGTLLADVTTGSGHALVRSADGGASWTQVLALGTYRSLTPHSFAELDGASYFLEYQVFTAGNALIRLWRSLNAGKTWAVRYTFQGHRHGHGMVADVNRHALWAFFGDTDLQSGVYRSTDAGGSWSAIVARTQDGDVVDAAVLSDGSLLCGQDISYLPPRPSIARIALDGTVTHDQTLPSASYSTHAIRAGGYVVGSTYELDNDVSPPGWTRGSLWGSSDGTRWDKLLEVDQLDPAEDVRTDVYWELPSGELVVNVRNADGFRPDGVGYLLLRVTRRSP